MKLNHNLLTIYIVLSENAKLIIIRIFRTTSQDKGIFFLDPTRCWKVFES